MRYVFLIILLLICNAWWDFSLLSSAAIAIWVWYVIELFEQSNERIAFKEFIMVTFGLNFLFSPALAYLWNQNSPYRMKLPEEDYFTLAVPCILLLHLGLNVIKTSIFQFHYKTVRLQSQLNQNMLVQWLYAGILIRFVNTMLPADLAFMFYLLSGIRFIAAYGLFIIDRKKYKWHLMAILFIELSLALQQGMFHDFVMWLVFFGLFWIYIEKPSKTTKLILGLSVLLAFYLIQITKADYRSRIKQEEAGLQTFQDAVTRNMEEEEGIFTNNKTTGTLTRVNQAWIFASTINRMQKVQDYQGLEIISKYAEAAFLPRYFAPNKLKAGDKEIFNKFSGHRINSGTSMGLGFFADGYIAFGSFGAYCFAFLLGLIFSLIFKLVERWSIVSPFFILLIFPILNYAVRPDCETQTIMGHIVKGSFVFACLTWYYSIYFSKKVQAVEQEENMAAIWRSRLVKRKVNTT